MNRTKEPPALPIGPNTKSWKASTFFGGILKRQWRKNGFVVIPGVFKQDQIQRYNSIVSRVRASVDDGKDEHGYGDRIGQLHQKEPDLLELASSPKIIQFLKWAFGDDPILMGSLQFQRGTQQEAHVDAIFFWPQPSFSMAGVWVALEDIHVDSGPLFYLPGSHKWPFTRSEHVAQQNPELAERRAIAASLDPDARNALVGDLGNAWTRELVKLESKYKKDRVPICMKAGDVVIWHSLLAHGGSPRNDPSRSRQSAVFHYLGRNTKLFTFEQFMLYDAADVPLQAPTAPEIAQHNGVHFMRFPDFVTYSNGKAILHPV